MKRSWCCERLKAGGEGDDRGWDTWLDGITDSMEMSLSKLRRWTWRPGVLQSMVLQRVGHDSVTELNWAVNILNATEFTERSCPCVPVESSTIQIIWTDEERKTDTLLFQAVFLKRCTTNHQSSKDTQTY